MVLLTIRLLRLCLSLLLLFGVHSQPNEWISRINSANMLWSPTDTSIPTRSMPMVGNGFIGTQISSTVIYLSGIFNGNVSNRAAIPSGLGPTGISITNTDPADAALDVEYATYYRRLILNPSGNNNNCTLNSNVTCTTLSVPLILEQRMYAHRALSSVLVMEIEVLRTNGSIDVDYSSSLPIAMLQLANAGNMGPSNDINFTAFSSSSSSVTSGTSRSSSSSSSSFDPSAVYSLQFGWTQMGETGNSSLMHAVMVLTENITCPYTVNGLWPVYSFNTTLTFLSVFRTSIETELSQLSNAVQADYSVAAALASEGTLHSTHIQEWHDTLWSSSGFGTDRMDVAQVVNTSLYTILSSVRLDRPFSLSPGSLATNAYEGHSFWDCETWMFVPVNLLYPDIAVSLLQYRLRTLPGAYHKASTYTPPYGGAMYSWESCVTGEEQAPPPWGVREVHISGDIAVALWQFWRVNQDINSGWLQSVAFPILSGIADFWMSRLAIDNPNATSNSPLHIVDVMPPDEYADHVTDCIWTNAGSVLSLHYSATVAQLLNLDPSVYTPWLDAANRIVIPFNDSINGGYHPEYTGYPMGQQVKQADVILLAFPMGFAYTYGNMTPASRANDLQIYGNVTDPNGPAMTWGAFAIGYAELQQYSLAASNFNRSYGTTQLPFRVWWETITGGTSNFITGAGGFLQTAFFGYTGLRINDTACSFINPSLPEHTTYNLLRGIAYLGSRIDILYTATSMEISVQPTPPSMDGGKQPVSVSSVNLSYPKTIMPVAAKQAGQIILPIYDNTDKIHHIVAAVPLQLIDSSNNVYPLVPGNAPVVLNSLQSIFITSVNS